MLYDPSEALQVSVSAMKLMGEAQPCVAFVSNTDDLAHNNSQLSLNISLEAFWACPGIRHATKDNSCTERYIGQTVRLG